MAKTLYSSIKQTIGADTLFTLDDVSKLKDTTDNAIKEEMSRLAKVGQVKRLGYGVYIIPTGKLTDDILESKFIAFRYLGSGKNVIGFLYGKCYIGGLLNETLPKTGLEIVTNKATSGKKAIFQFGQRIVLRKPFVAVNSSNVTLLAFLTYVSQASKEDIKHYYPVLANLVREEHLSAIETSSLLPFFPAKTAKILLAEGFYKLMWRH